MKVAQRGAGIDCERSRAAFKAAASNRRQQQLRHAVRERRQHGAQATVPDDRRSDDGHRFSSSTFRHEG